MSPGARRALLRLAWAVVVGLALVVVDVWLGPARPSLVLLVGVAPWLLFLAWPVAVAAAIRRRPVLAVAGLVLVVVQLSVLLPSYAPWHSPAAARPGTTFRVFDANVEFDNRDLRGIARQIAADRPDVVALEELSTQNLPSLQATGVLADYPYRVVIPTSDARGYGLWSRLPLRDTGQYSIGGLGMVGATIAAPGGPVSLLVVHTVSPPAGTSQWTKEMRALTAYARDHRDGSLLMVGDFNATMAMRQLRQVLHAGVRDGASENGAGWDMTWAANGRTIVPIMRLDHALVTRALTVTDYRLGHASGSDHRPLVFTVGDRA